MALNTEEASDREACKGQLLCFSICLFLKLF